MYHGRIIPVSRAALVSGLIRALAGTSLKRSTLFPDLPTVAESGLPGQPAAFVEHPVVDFQAFGVHRRVVWDNGKDLYMQLLRGRGGATGWHGDY